MKRSCSTAILLACLLINPALAQEGDAESGNAAYRRQCASCHQVAQPRNGVGPNLQGIIGRPAGSVEGFNYSAAMRDSGITWTPETLNTFLADPRAMVAGTRMMLRVADEQQRLDIIAFLATQVGP